LAAIFRGISDQHDTDLGQQQEIAAYASRIQHTLDVVKLYGVGTELGKMKKDPLDTILFNLFMIVTAIGALIILFGFPLMFFGII
jgi:hypothetical protein